MIIWINNENGEKLFIKIFIKNKPGIEEGEFMVQEGTAIDGKIVAKGGVRFEYEEVGNKKVIFCWDEDEFVK